MYFHTKLHLNSKKKSDNFFVIKDRVLLFDSSDETQQEETSKIENVNEKIANQGETFSTFLNS